MSCIVLEFILVFLTNTQSYEIALKQECLTGNSLTDSTIEFKLETSFKSIQLLSYNHNDKIYTAKLKD